jgi:protein involved in polysaccharide export with SLBB domain
MRKRSPLALCALLGWLAGCYPITTEPLPPDDRAAAAPRHPATYVIQAGDTLGVRFYQHNELDEEVIVRPDGKISLQLIGDLQAAGQQPELLAAAIDELYRSELTAARATVVVRELGAKVWVGGEVEEPGAIPLTANLTLFEAVQEAGTFKKEAHLKQVVLIRREADGKPRGWAVDVRPTAGGLDPGTDVPLQPYDIVWVPRSKIADVNLFVEQYIRNNLPIEFALPVF